MVGYAVDINGISFFLTIFLLRFCFCFFLLNIIFFCEGQLVDAVVVEKEKARNAYETEVFFLFLSFLAFHLFHFFFLWYYYDFVFVISFLKS